MSYDTSQQPEVMQQRYRELPDELTELFEYGSVDHIIGEIKREFGLREEEVVALRMEIELVLYCFLPKSGLAERLQESSGVDIEKARLISRKLTQELFVVVDDILTEVEKQFSEDMATVGPPVIVVPPAPSEQTSVDPQTASPDIDDNNQLKPLRTFAMDVDMNRAHGYGAFHSGEQTEDEEPVHRSSQDDIIKK